MNCRSRTKTGTPCQRKSKINGLCQQHYNQQGNGKPILVEQECPIMTDLVTSEKPLTQKDYVTLKLLAQDEVMKDVIKNYTVEKIDLYKYFDLVTQINPTVDNDGKCGFNNQCVTKYLNKIGQLDPILENSMQQLLKMTRYVSHSELSKRLNVVFNKFEAEIGQDPFTLIYTSKTPNSEYLCIWLLWSRIKKLNLKHICHYQDKIPTSKALWIDDCSYSGGNMCETCDVTSKKSHVYVVVAFVAPFALYDGPCGNQWPTNMTLLYDELLPRFSDKSHHGVISKYFWSSEMLSPIYFDHKIASPESTFNYIYFGLIPYIPLSEEDMNFDCCPIHTKERIQICKQIPNRNIINKLSEILITNWNLLLKHV
jgi:hypothetical protein